jgi:hypothetical protein
MECGEDLGWWNKWRWNVVVEVGSDGRVSGVRLRWIDRVLTEHVRST